MKKFDQKQLKQNNLNHVPRSLSSASCHASSHTGRVERVAALDGGDLRGVLLDVDGQLVHVGLEGRVLALDGGVALLEVLHDLEQLLSGVLGAWENKVSDKDK